MKTQDVKIGATYYTAFRIVKCKVLSFHEGRRMFLIQYLDKKTTQVFAEFSLTLCKAQAQRMLQMMIDDQYV